MPGEAALPHQNAAMGAHVPERRYPGRSARLLWTASGFAVLMLIGFSACALIPVVSRAPSKPSRLVTEVAFNPSLTAPRAPMVYTPYPVGKSVPHIDMQHVYGYIDFKHRLVASLGNMMGYRRGGKTYIDSEQLQLADFALLSDVKWNQEQAFPPNSIHSIDTEALLKSWADAMLDPADPKAILLHNMYHDVQDWTRAMGEAHMMDEEPEAFIVSQPLEVAGLVKAPTTDGSLPEEEDLQRAASKHGASVSAIALFSREKLKGDSKGNLHRIVEAQFGIGATRGFLGRRKKVNVFEIKGLAMSPDTRGTSAKVLLAKIAKWAETEQRLVVVPKSVYRTRGIARDLKDPQDLTEEDLKKPKDLTKYYKKLGFEKVTMDDGSYELVLIPRWVKWSMGRSSSAIDSKIIVSPEPRYEEEMEQCSLDSPVEACVEEPQLMVNLDLAQRLSQPLRR